MALLVLFSLIVVGSFAATLMPVKRTVTVVVEAVYEPPLMLPAVVPVAEPVSSDSAETVVGLRFSVALSIRPADTLKEAA